MSETGHDCTACQRRMVVWQQSLKDTRYQTTPRQEFTVYRCLNCGLLSVDSSELDLASFYPEDYAPHFTDTDSKRSLSARLFEKYLEFVDDMTGLPSMADTVSNYVSQGGSVLDVGCGSGSLIGELVERGCDATGCDVSENAAQSARKQYGVDVAVGELHTLDFESEEFDAVVMNHSFEHVDKPHQYLQEIHRILKPNGVLVVEVPNADSIEFGLFGRHWCELDAPRHVFNWTPDALQHITSNHDLKIVTEEATASPRALRNSLRGWLSAKIGVDTPRVDLLDLPLVVPMAVSSRTQHTGRYQAVYRRS